MKEKIEVLLNDEYGEPEFYFLPLSIHDHVMEFNVYSYEEIQNLESCDLDNTDTYLFGSIFFDGCSNINFSDRFMHFCGKRGFDSHAMMMINLFGMAKKYIKNYAADVAE